MKELISIITNSRSFLVVTASEGTFVTGRQAGKLLGVKLTFDKGVITLQANGATPLTCDLTDIMKDPKVVESK